MTDETVNGPMVFPEVRRIGFTAPFEWLRAAWADLWKIPFEALTYGVFLAFISAGLSWGLFYSGQSGLVFVLSSGFLLVGPMIAMGLYEAGRQLELGGKPTLKDMLFVRTQSVKWLAYLGLALLVIFFFWMNIGKIVYGLSTFKAHSSIHDFLRFVINDPEGHTMLITGSIIGAGLAFLTYCLVVVTAPMLMEQNTNIATATITSFKAVTQNLFPMLLWAFLLAMLTFLGIVTAFLGLIIVFPWLGLASWHAYRALVDHKG